ncbi:TetR/AcrR family transcriptional regulator, partial [uncultured Actinomyces sp.]|uniref:TetR/AcrR family transcriptional regulator n=1 Tax=uncultured Actinomyces sp. TaxID=249061 RepID=UPI0026060523
MAAKRTRLSAIERREQLITTGRSVFAARGFDATTVEEIANKAGVTKPVVYEHFGGKEGLYAVIVDREVQLLVTTITNSLNS